jgi:hypothetical protein
VGHLNIWTKVLHVTDGEAEFIFGGKDCDLNMNGKYKLKRT